MLPEHVAIPNDIEEAAILTDYAVMCRYPGDSESVTQAEYEQAVRIAEAVLEWAKQMIR
jgi:HEPN domain-containing protein